MIKDGLNQLWATPVYKTKINNDLCNELLELLLQKDFNDYSNGSTNLFKIESPVVEKFKKEVFKIFDEYFKIALSKNLKDYNSSFNGWITGRPGAYYMKNHNHASSPFVSVFYIFASETDQGGEIILNDPRVNANRGYMIDFQDPFNPISFKPITGDVLVFPGYLYHSVNHFMGSLRVAVPVDLFLDSNED